MTAALFNLIDYLNFWHKINIAAAGLAQVSSKLGDDVYSLAAAFLI
jgi:hypothetical protein